MNQQGMLIGLKQTINPEYQFIIHNIAKGLMDNKQTISLDSLKKSAIFSQLAKTDDKKIRDNLYNAIEDFAGKEIDLVEMKTILIFLDAKLKKIDNAEKFVMDGKFEVKENSGIFQATKNEKWALSKYVSIYDFDNPNGGEYPYEGPDGNKIIKLTPKKQ